MDMMDIQFVLFYLVPFYLVPMEPVCTYVLHLVIFVHN